jgi:acetyl esterase/lipase
VGEALRLKHRTVRGGGGRLRLVPLLVLLAGLIVGSVALAFWSWVDAQARAVVVISSVLDAPILTPAAEAASGEPRLSDVVVAGNRTLVARPAGEGPWPAVFVVNGTVPEGRKLPEVRRLAEGFARAGYLAVVPDLPGLTEDRITPETVQETGAVAREVSERRDAEGERVALVGVSTGATLALLAAERPSLRGRVSVVAGVAPYADIRTVLNVATTGFYRDGAGFRRHEADPFLSYAIARSLVAALPPGEDRRTLSGELAGVDREDPNPLAGLRSRPTGDLGPAAKSVVELLANEDPRRFDKLYGALPEGVRADLRALSPLAGEGRVQAPVEVATGPRDKYFPASESYDLGRVAPERRVTVTRALDHARLEFSLGDAPAFAAFDAFVVRALREARLTQ